MPAVETIDTVKLFVNGRLVDAKSSRHGQVFNPSIGESIADVPFCSKIEMDEIVHAARAVERQRQRRSDLIAERGGIEQRKTMLKLPPAGLPPLLSWP